MEFLLLGKTKFHDSSMRYLKLFLFEYINIIILFDIFKEKESQIWYSEMVMGYVITDCYKVGYARVHI